MSLVALCYKIGDLLPKHEQYSLISQMTRSAISIPSNIAEGYRRNGTKEYILFCGIASGSAAELETQLLIVKKVYGYTSVDEALSLVSEIQKMLYALIKQLVAKP